MSKADMKKEIKYTIKDATDWIEPHHDQKKPDIIEYHILTNDLRDNVTTTRR